MVEPLRHTQLLPGTLQNLFYPPDDYVYFKRVGEMPFHEANPLQKAAWAVDAAMLAYARYGSRRMNDGELTSNFDRAHLAYEKIGGTASDWNAHGTQAVFAHCPDFAIFAFRGTEADDPDDLLSDINLALHHEPDYRPARADSGPALGFFSFVSHLFEKPCLVHRGFQLALNGVWEKVHGLFMDYRATFPNAEICFTGHSLGGALSVLAFSRFADENISLYTFGCPRVGNDAFRDRALSNRGKGIYRYVNYNDAVTHVPTDSLLYRQIPEESQRFDENGNLDTDNGSFRGDAIALQAAIAGLPASLKLAYLNNIPAPPSLVDHSPARYCFRLWDCV